MPGQRGAVGHAYGGSPIEALIVAASTIRERGAAAENVRHVARGGMGGSLAATSECVTCLVAPHTLVVIAAAKLWKS
jgi:hypothetical protein